MKEEPEARILKGRVWFAPIGAPPPNATDDAGNPVTIDENGVLRWTPLTEALGHTPEDKQ